MFRWWDEVAVDLHGWSFGTEDRYLNGSSTNASILLQGNDSPELHKLIDARYMLEAGST